MEDVEQLRSHFAHNLTRLREKRNLTQAALANALNERYKLDLKRASLANYEAGEAMPKIETLYGIAAFFGITIDDLIKENPVFPDTENLDESTSKNQKTAQTLVSSKNDEASGGSGNFDELAKGYAETQRMNRFYVVFVKKLLNALNDLGKEDEDYQAELKHIFGQNYVDCLYQNTNFFHRLAEDVLDEQEYAVFVGYDLGSGTDMLALSMNLPPKAVMEIFNRASAKIRAALNDKTQNSRI